MKLAMFASGTGTNVQAIIDAVHCGQLQAELVGLVCDQRQAAVIERAEQAGIPVFVASLQDYETRQEWEDAMVNFLKKQEAEWIALAGFMRIVGKPLLKAFPHRIINIHPSLLPNFPGRDGIGDAYRAGACETGVTIHYVDEGIDTGPIIAQQKLSINPDWTEQELAEKIHKIEHQLYPNTLKTLSEKEEN